MDSRKLGAFISQRRKALGLTQEELAGGLGVTGKAVSKWETGQGCPDLGTITGLAQALGVGPGELLAAGEEGGAEVRAEGPSTPHPGSHGSGRGRAGPRAPGILLGLSLLGAFTSVLVDFLTSGRLSWGRYVLGGLALPWLTALPLLILGWRRGRFPAVAALTGASLGLSWLVAASLRSAWFLPLALPACLGAGLTLALLLGLGQSRLALPTKAGLAILLVGLGFEYLMDRLVGAYLGPLASGSTPTVVVMLASALLGLGLLLLGLVGRTGGRRA